MCFRLVSSFIVFCLIRVEISLLRTLHNSPQMHLNECNEPDF